MILKSLKLLQLCILLSSCYVYATVQEAEENTRLTIKCDLASEGIRINSAIWQYKRTIGNMFTPNWRNFAFFWGPEAGIGKWDVSRSKMLSDCNGRNICNDLLLTNDQLEAGTNYQMFLTLDYDCLPYCDNTKSGRACVESNSLTFKEVLNALETHFGTQQRHDLGAITQITMREVPNRRGINVPLVYVLRAKITKAAVKSRDTFPAEIESRMRELNALPDDDRGYLLASVLGGPKHILNFAPLHATLNRLTNQCMGGTCEWWQIERDLRAEINYYDDALIDWTLLVRYDNSENDFNFRPVGFAIRAITHYRNSDGKDVEDYRDIYIPNKADAFEKVDKPLPKNWFNSLH